MAKIFPKKIFPKRKFYSTNKPIVSETQRKKYDYFVIYIISEKEKTHENERICSDAKINLFTREIMSI